MHKAVYKPSYSSLDHEGDKATADSFLLAQTHEIKTWWSITAVLQWSGRVNYCFCPIVTAAESWRSRLDNSLLNSGMHVHMWELTGYIQRQRPFISQREVDQIRSSIYHTCTESAGVKQHKQGNHSTEKSVDSEFQRDWAGMNLSFTEINSCSLQPGLLVMNRNSWDTGNLHSNMYLMH